MRLINSLSETRVHNFNDFWSSFQMLYNRRLSSLIQSLHGDDIRKDSSGSGAEGIAIPANERGEIRW